MLSLLEDCCAYFAECDHCVFVIVKAAASSGSHCVRKQPVMSSESRVADCRIRERQTVCMQPTNSSANTKFTAPGIKFNKTPQRPGPANSTGQHILCWPFTRAIITLYTAISNLGLCEHRRAHVCVSTSNKSLQLAKDLRLTLTLKYRFVSSTCCFVSLAFNKALAKSPGCSKEFIIRVIIFIERIIHSFALPWRLVHSHHMPLFPCFYSLDVLLFNHWSIWSHVLDSVVTWLFCIRVI